MKRLLSILSLFILLLAGQEIITISARASLPKNKVIITNENQVQSSQNKLDNLELGQIADSCLCTTNRIQQNTKTNERLFKTTSRLFESFIQKEQNNLNKIEEIVSVSHTLKCSSLRIRSGHWVYVLRKIII